MVKRKQYIATKIDESREAFLVSRETWERDPDDETGTDANLLAKEMVSVFMGTWNQCQSYVSFLTREESDSLCTYTFEKIPIVIPTGVTLEVSTKRKVKGS